MSERNLYEVTGDIKDINTLLVSREEWNRRAQPAQRIIELEDKQPQADLLAAAKEFCRKVEAGEARSTTSYAAFKLAIERIEKQPQAEAVPVVDRVYEAAKRLVDHADFQLGGVLSAKSKARDIPSNAASKVKARHLASLRDALAKAPQQAEAVPSDVVRDAERLDYLQHNGSTVELLPGVGGFLPMRFRVGGLHVAVSESIRGAIDAAIAAQGEKP